MSTPFPFKTESELFGKSLLQLTQDAHRLRITQYVSEDNLQRLHHGKGWLNVGEHATDESLFREAGVELSLDYAQITENNVQSLIDFLDNFVEGFTSQIVRQMFENINDACEKSGNVIKNSDYPSKAEAFLEMLRTIDFSVNERGEVELPSLHVGSEYAQAIITELGQQGATFDAEVERIQKEKIAAAYDRERIRLSKFLANKA